MNRSIPIIAAGAVMSATLALAAAPATSSDQIAQVRTVGEPVDCVSISRIRDTDVVDDKTIDFKMIGGKTYRNTLSNSCPGLQFEDRFSYRATTSQLCNVDTIRVLENWGGKLQNGAGCGLGKFQQIEKVKG